MTPLEQQLRAAGYQGSFGDLDQLIDECGVEFLELRHQKITGTWRDKYKGWMAFGENKDGKTTHGGNHPSRIEAVQSLLLSLLQDKSA